MAGILDSNPAVSEFRRLVNEVGRAALHSLYPNEFEAYFCSLELVDYLGRTIDFFAFPVMPKSMSYGYPTATNIKQSDGGVTIMKRPHFVPRDIQIMGNFGKRFKFLVGRNQVDAMAIRFSSSAGVFTKEEVMAGGLQTKAAILNSQIRTGYGCTKILQSIIDKAQALDTVTGQQFSLYFYNTVIGESYLVEPLNMELKMGMDENMIWNYTLQLKGVSPISGLRPNDGQESLTKTMQYGVLSRGLDSLMSAVKRAI
jgi:hypothetical protein